MPSSAPVIQTRQPPVPFKPFGGGFARKMGMLACRDNLGFGMRSWRYAAVVDDGIVTGWFEERGYADNCETDPYGESAPQNILEKLAARVAKDRSGAFAGREDKVDRFRQRGLVKPAPRVDSAGVELTYIPGEPR